MWHQKTEMGAVIRKDYQNKGVMIEIIEKVLPFGFLMLGLNRIVGDIFAGN
jgi:ribosomal-protein-alanine N-acetyltransferase